jgi:hypothetical protein
VVEFFLLAVLVHFTVDIVFQPDFVAKFKARKNSLAAIPWYYVLMGHAASHGLALGFLALVLCDGLPKQIAINLVLFETFAHFVIDVLKNEDLTNIHSDQFLHVVCKAVYAVSAAQAAS